MNKSIIDKMEEAMRRPVPYEGLLGREFAPFGKRTDASEESRSLWEETPAVSSLRHDARDRDGHHKD